MSKASMSGVSETTSRDRATSVAAESDDTGRPPRLEKIVDKTSFETIKEVSKIAWNPPVYTLSEQAMAGLYLNLVSIIGDAMPCGSKGVASLVQQQAMRLFEHVEPWVKKYSGYPQDDSDQDVISLFKSIESLSERVREEFNKPQAKKDEEKEAVERKQKDIEQEWGRLAAKYVELLEKGDDESRAQKTQLRLEMEDKTKEEKNLKEQSFLPTINMANKLRKCYYLFENIERRTKKTLPKIIHLDCLADGDDDSSEEGEIDFGPGHPDPDEDDVNENDNKNKTTYSC